MKPRFRFLTGVALAASSLAASAQIIRVEITSPANESAVAYNPGASLASATATIVPAGGVVVALTNGGSGYSALPTITLSGGGGTGATAVVTGLNGDQLAGIAFTPGTGYTSAPTLTFAGGGGGRDAAASVAVTPGAVAALTLTSPGAGYTSAPAVTFSGGGGSGATATTTIVDGAISSITLTNAGSGYVTVPNVVIAQPGGVVTVAARVVGTTTYTTQFFVDGRPISASLAGESPQTSWNPPQPGAYFITARTSDAFGNSAVSQPVRVFVSGARIYNPVPNTLVPLGSSVVISADGLFANPAAPDSFGGLVKQIEFFAERDGLPGRELVGVDATAPYSAPFTPRGLGVHRLIAVATDNYGQTVASAPVPIRVVQPIGAPPTASIVNPVNDSVVVAGRELNIIASANDADGLVNKVEFYLNGTLLNTDTTFPFTATWTPPVAGTYSLVALVFDDKGNVTTSTPSTVIVRGELPSARLRVPVSQVVQGAKVDIEIDAEGPGGGATSLRLVEFLVDGNVYDFLPKTSPTDEGPPPLGESPFDFTWRSNVAIGEHRLSARVTDINNISITSQEVIVRVVPNQLPQVIITGPSADEQISPNTPVTLVAAASDADGSVESVEFFVNGKSIGKATTQSPYQLVWTPAVPGPYTITARALDDANAAVDSAPLQITVDRGAAPSVALSSPGDGAVVRIGTGTVLAANAADADGSIASVQFFANGSPIGAPITTAPFRTTWTPAAAGIFRVTAAATDNAGVTTTSTVANVLVVAANAAAGDSISTGNYQGLGENGRFTAINAGGRTGAVVAYSTTEPGKVYFFSGLEVDSAGRFTGTDAASRATISAGFSDTGVTGQLGLPSAASTNPLTLIGIDTRFTSTTNGNVPAGYYTGNLDGRSGSLFVALVGHDGSITTLVADGNFRDAGAGALAPNGTFRVTTAAGNRFDGKLDLATGFLSGSLTGGPGGSFTAAAASGASFSDGFLRNLSTRGQVGTGANVLIAGFVVGGDAPKRVLVRAIGSSLAGFGVSGALSDTQLEIFNGATRIASNDNWGGDSAIAAAAAQVGAFPLASGSFDSAALLTLEPGAYTAQVSGVGGRTGIALLELYDVDTPSAFSTQKVMNVATRGPVAAGQGQLIAGFVISGNTPKKVLVRAVGPTLGGAPFNLSGVLADPVLRIVRNDGTTVRENDNWQTGNDPALIATASTRVGAFPLTSGSRDSAILINLPPGTYNAQVSGQGTGTGLALVEVYEVP